MNVEIKNVPIEIANLSCFFYCFIINFFFSTFSHCLCYFHFFFSQVITELGKNNIMISVADKELNWNDISLNEEQSKAFKQFMRENDI